MFNFYFQCFQQPPTGRMGAIEAEKKQLYEQIQDLKTQLLNKDKEIVSLATDGNKYGSSFTILSIF